MQLAESHNVYRKSCFGIVAWEQGNGMQILFIHYLLIKHAEQHVFQRIRKNPTGLWNYTELWV